MSFLFPASSGGAAAAAAVLRPSCGRLSLTSGVPVTTADVTGATGIRLEPYDGSELSFLTAEDALTSATFSGTGLSLGTLVSGKHYDVFGYVDAGVVALELSAAWTSDTARSVGVSLVNGIPIKTSDHTRRLLGTFRTTSTTQTEDSVAQRFLCSLLSPKIKNTHKSDVTVNWAYTGAWRVSNGSTANKACWVQSLDGVFALIGATISSSCLTDAARYGGVSLNNSAASPPNEWGSMNGVAISSCTSAILVAPRVGLNEAFAMELGTTGATFYGYGAGHRVWALPAV